MLLQSVGKCWYSPKDLTLRRRMPSHSSLRGAVCPDMYLLGDSPADSGSPSSVVGWRSANKLPRVRSSIMHGICIQTIEAVGGSARVKGDEMGKSPISTIKKIRLISASLFGALISIIGDCLMLNSQQEQETNAFVQILNNVRSCCRNNVSCQNTIYVLKNTLFEWVTSFHNRNYKSKITLIIYAEFIQNTKLLSLKL